MGGGGRRGARPKRAPEKPRAEGPRSWLWVDRDETAGGKRYYMREASLGVEIAPEGGATLDLFAERGGGGAFVGLTVQALRVPRVRALADLAGQEVIDPPPAAPVAIGRIGPLVAGAAAESPAPAAAAPAEPEVDLDAEEAAPDDDPLLGDMETYRRRRAEEGARETAEPEPELDESALEEAEAKAESERAIVTPGQAYEVTSIRLKFGALRGGTIDIDVLGLCASIDEEGAVERADIPFGGRLTAQVEVA